MAVRVTSIEIKGLVDTERDVDQFIETANLIVDEELLSEGHSDARLKQIELYLAAHFLTITEEHGGLMSSSEGESKETFNPGDEGKGGGYQMTRYGQQAMALDVSGVLSSQSRTTNKAEFRVV